MSDTYTRFAAICAQFYELTIESAAVARFLVEKTALARGERVLFVGGLFGVAASLARMGFELTVVDYSEDMTRIAATQIPTARVLTADLRSLPFNEEFHVVLVPGRVFTHMLSDADLQAAVESCRRSLLPNGRLFADNYESDKIEVTSYFNGRITCSGPDISILRTSTTERLSTTPHIVSWRAHYTGEQAGTDFDFSDSIDHRAFTRNEFATHLSSFDILEQGPNFDETSFYTVAARSR